MTRDSAKDITLHSDNTVPRGIWSDGTTMWVMDSTDDKLYAYKMSDKMRDDGKDFNALADADNGSPNGIWSDGTTMWVSDPADIKLYAYNMSNKNHDSGKDFHTLFAAGNTYPTGIWSDGSTMWVVDSTDDKVYAYQMPQPTAYELSVTSATQDANGVPVMVEGSAGVTVTVTVTSGGPLASAETLTLEWDGTAVGGTDLPGGLLALPSGTTGVTIDAGSSSGSVTLTADDDEAYTPEFAAELTAILGTSVVDATELAWRDDEAGPEVTIAASPTTVTEGDDVDLTVTLNRAFRPVVGGTFSLEILIDNPKFMGSTLLVSLVPGETEVPRTVAVPDDPDQSDPYDVVYTLQAFPNSHYTLGDPSSATVQVLDDDTPPTAPQSLTASTAGSGAVRLTWNEPQNGGGGQPIRKYQYRHAQGSSVPAATGWTDVPDSVEGGANRTSYTVRNLTDDQLFAFEVRAVNGADLEGPAAMTSETPVAGVPVKFNVRSQSADEDGSVTVTVKLGEAPAAGTSVTIPIEASPGTGLEANEYSGVPQNVTFTAGETSVSFTVDFHGDGEDEPNEALVLSFGTPLPAGYASVAPFETILTLVDDDTPAPMVRHFRGVSGSQTAIPVIWFAERHAHEYKLEYRKGGTTDSWTRITRGDFDHLPSTSSNRLLAGIATGLECNTAYDFRISMRGDGEPYVNAFGPHAETSHRTGECARTDRPTNLLTTVTPECAILSWTAPTGGDYTGVRVRRLEPGEHNYTTIHESLNSAPTSYRDCRNSGDGYGDGDRPSYNYRITYIKSDGAGGATKSEYAQTGFGEYGPSEVPWVQPPRNVRLTRDTDSQRRMGWAAPPSLDTTIMAGLQGRSLPTRDPWITGYVVERREFRVRGDDDFYFPENEDWEVVREGNDGNTGTSYTDNEDANGRKFVYRIMTTNALGRSSGDYIFDWLWDSPHRDAVIDLAATDTTSDGSAENNGNTRGDETNNPATGAPTISGTAQVGETLTAGTSDISDSDGLTSVSYSYQWLADGADINGATGSTYQVSDDDVGKTIKVKVSFTDDANNEESLTSAATGQVTAAVAARPDPLTAALENNPASHDGSADFTFEVRFSEEFRRQPPHPAGPRLYRNGRHGGEGGASGCAQQHTLENHGATGRQRGRDHRPARDHGLQRARGHLHRG